MNTELPGSWIVEHFDGSGNQGNEHWHNMIWLTVLLVENRLKVGKSRSRKSNEGGIAIIEN